MITGSAFKDGLRTFVLDEYKMSFVKWQAAKKRAFLIQKIWQQYAVASISRSNVIQVQQT